jgi:ABC-2 type transport system ATP-binding protein
VLRDLTGSRPQVDQDTRRLSVPAMTGSVALPDLVRRLDAAGVEAEDVTVRRPTLDEVFLAQTNARSEVAA